MWVPFPIRLSTLRLNVDIPSYPRSRNCTWRDSRSRNSYHSVPTRSFGFGVCSRGNNWPSDCSKHEAVPEGEPYIPCGCLALVSACSWTCEQIWHSRSMVWLNSISSKNQMLVSLKIPDENMPKRRFASIEHGHRDVMMAFLHQGGFWEYERWISVFEECPMPELWECWLSQIWVKISSSSRILRLPERLKSSTRIQGWIGCFATEG